MDADRHLEIARCLFRESNDALFLFDTFTHRVIDLNPAAVRLTGFDKQLASTKTVWDLFTSELGSGLDPLVEAYRNTGFYHSRDGFFLARRKDEPIPVNISVSRIHTTPTPMGLVVVRDVTERKKAEAAVRESEARYRGLVETARVIFWSTDAMGRVTSLNPQFTTVTGWEAADWIGRDFADMFSDDEQKPAQFWIQSAAEGSVPVASIDLRVIGKTGQPLVLEFLSAARLGEGEGAEISGIARDVTELRNAAEAIRQSDAIQLARKTAELADRAKSEFLAHVSHEIRTPMTSILGFIDLLLHDNAVQLLPQQRLDDMRTIEQNGAHLLKLIDDILDISRIEAGKLLLDLAPCSPLQVTTEVLSAFQLRASTKGIALHLSIKSAIPASMKTDWLRLRQILMNLIGNAVKFTQSGDVSVEIEVTGRETCEPQLAIEVADTGSGMTGGQIEQLFKAFSRPTPDSDGRPGGTGLGLAISRRLAEMLGGSISVESVPGEGSRFRLLLPVEKADGAEWIESRSPAFTRMKQLAPAPNPHLQAKILLAEDNADIQRVTALHLQQFGSTVITARNGQEALDHALAASEAGQPFDVVLMDMQMPVLDGYEATRQLRAKGFRGSIIALTAYAMAEDREECLVLGCNEHISKPIDWDRLAEVLTQEVARVSR